MSAESQRQDAEVRGLDPWGLRRVERLLRTVEGVDSLKIVPDGGGGIEEIHVLSASELGAKQIVRNIESALLAQFGLQVDHRKISIAQVRVQDLPRPEAEAAPGEAPLPGPEAQPETAPRRLLFETFRMERTAGELVRCVVELREGEEIWEGAAEGPDYAKARLEAAGGAALAALDAAMDGKASFALEGVTEVDRFGRRLLVAVIQARSGRRAVALPGVAKIEDSAEEAAVMACLMATNRWIWGP